MDRICKHCGLPIENPTPHQQAHKECQRKHDNEYQKTYYKRKRGFTKKPPLPEKFCLTCGKPLAEYGNRRRDYCPECAEIRHKEGIKKQSKQRNLDCKNARKKKPIAKPEDAKVRTKPIRFCWDLECKSAMQVDIEARTLGLTYGKYSSLIDTLMIERYLNNEGIYDGLKRIDKAWRKFKRERAEEAEKEKARQEEEEKRIAEILGGFNERLHRI